MDARVIDRTVATVVAVSSDALRPELLELLFVYDRSDAVIVVESIARAYARIAQLRPALVLLLMEIDDADACRLLSILQTTARCTVSRCCCARPNPDAVAHCARDAENRPDRLMAANC